MLKQFLIANPQYQPREGEPLDPRVDFYIWDLSTGGKGPNGCLFGAGSLAGGIRKGDRTLFQRVRDGEGTSNPPQLSPEIMETIRQLALSEARRESEQREASLKAQLEEQQRLMQQQQSQMELQQRQMEAMNKRQADMEAMMRQFMQSQGSGNVGGNEGASGQGQVDGHVDDDDFAVYGFSDQD